MNDWIFLKNINDCKIIIGMKPSFILEWNVNELSRALKINEDDVIEYFTDGRRVSFLMERSIRNHFGWKLSPSEGAAFDLVDQNNARWEVRSVSKNIYFCPSYMVGSGRDFDLDGFLEKLNQVSGYILTDIMSFPHAKVWKISVETVRKWWDQGKLGDKTHVSRKTILQLLEEL